jgi:hypothetical protein
MRVTFVSESVHVEVFTQVLASLQVDTIVHDDIAVHEFISVHVDTVFPVHIVSHVDTAFHDDAMFHVLISLHVQVVMSSFVEFSVMSNDAHVSVFESVHVEERYLSAFSNVI